MLPIVRGAVSGRLRRPLSTAATRPPWVMMDREIKQTKSRGGVSCSFRPPPSASSITIPIWSLALEPPGDKRAYMDTMRCRLLAASSDGFLLLDTLKSRVKLPDGLPVEALRVEAVLLKAVPSEPVCRWSERRVCNPVTGELLCLPDFPRGGGAAGKASTGCTDGTGMGLLTQAPEARYAAAQLSVAHDGRRFLLRRFDSRKGVWEDDLVLPSPLPPGRRMHMVLHEVFDFGGRLWWVDVSWGAVCLDPFCDQPQLRPVELPAGTVLAGSVSRNETNMRILDKHRRMGVSVGRLVYAEADAFHVRSFALDDESGSWTLEHDVSVASLWPDVKVLPSIAAIDPLDSDVLHLNVKEFTISVDLRQEKVMVGAAFLQGGVSPQSAASSYLPCVLPSFLGSTPIPGNNDVKKNKTLADVLVRSDRQPKT
ncbi:uncharacterized protein LOC100837603 [Brachypodium distachyon]|uniref:DUF1618 domain-containing protein n=1 Tax=Brachypodium distachyon TaxID=15368 RepID=I1ITU4_BRADI|nr:uncharacterized protein LOC100837603 [Brachypodium distachyon]KQJ91966.1 hypothetical protein BRADI_4g40890v3 [Brachypodium distachyon]|eukprot:XP_003576989.2 uncharacterized protein LOC100837603 [Brachypodium distachyon]